MSAELSGFYLEPEGETIEETAVATFKLVAWFSDDWRRVTEPMPELSPTTQRRLNGMLDEDPEFGFMAALGKLAGIGDEKMQQALYSYMCGYSDDDMTRMFPDVSVSHLDEIVASWQQQESVHEVKPGTAVTSNPRRIGRIAVSEETASKIKLPKALSTHLQRSLDDDRYVSIDSFSPVQRDYLALGMGKLYRKYAPVQSHGFADTYTNRIQQMLHGVTQRKIYENEGMNTVHLRHDFLYRSPDTFRIYADELVKVFDVVVGLQSDFEGTAEELFSSLLDISDTAQKLPASIANLLRPSLDDDRFAKLELFSPAQRDFFALGLGQIHDKYASMISRKHTGKYTRRIRQMLHGATEREVAENEGVSETRIRNNFLYRLPNTFSPHADEIVTLFDEIADLPPDAEGPAEELFAFLDSMETSFRLPTSIINLLRPSLDDDRFAMLELFSPAQRDFFALGIGRIFDKYAPQQARKSTGTYTNRIRQMLHGATEREVAENEGVGEGSLRHSFLYRLPNILSPHVDEIVDLFDAIADLPPDAEGPAEEQFIFTVETPAKKRTPRKRTPRPKADRTPTDRPAIAPSESPAIKLAKSTIKPEKVPNGKPVDTKNPDSEFNNDVVRAYLKSIGKAALLNAEEEVELAMDIEAGLYAKYKLDWLGGETVIARPKIENKETEVEVFASRERYALSADEKRELGRMVLKGDISKNKFAEANLRLVVSLAKRYTGRGMPLLDLIQEGNLGLMHAVEMFDYTKGFKFSTYATWWIRQAITRSIAEKGRTIRLPVHMAEKVNTLARIRRDMLQELGREATIEELAAESDISAETVQDLLEQGRDPVSLDMPFYSDKTAPLSDFIEDESALSTEDAVMPGLLSDDISKVIASLDERESQVIRLRFGLDDGQPKTLDQIGQLFGLSRERIRQIERDVMTKLRHGERADALREYHKYI